MSTQSTHAGLGEVGVTLVELLFAGLEQRMEIDREHVALASPDEASGQVRLTVYLYRVTENDHLRDMERKDGTGDGSDVDTTTGSPLVLDLHYLVTAHPNGGQGGGGSTPTAVKSEQHGLLSRAMQVLHENSILRGADLSGSFGGRELRISLESRPTDELTNLWSTFGDQPFRPSAAYRVTPVVIESTETRDLHRVVDRRVEEHSGP